MWRYSDLLCQVIQILFEISLGILVCIFGPFSLDKHLPGFKLFVFNILLPCSIATVLGFTVDFRDGSIWKFIGAFLMMRALVLILDLGWALLRQQQWCEVSLNWLVNCWVSTTILAPPMLKATLGQRYEKYGPIAAVSSLIFQLPLLLLFFEMDALPEQVGASKTSLYSKRLNRQEWKTVGKSLVRKPIIWSILFGVLMSVTTLGPRYLYPGTPYEPNCDYVPPAGFIYLFFQTLASCLEPVALFSVGVVLSQLNPFTMHRGILNITFYMLIKMILVPAIMIGCCFAFKLPRDLSRAAVLISVLPVSPEAFALAGWYNVGLGYAVSNVVVGKFLCFPAILAWQAFMDAVSLFPYPQPPVMEPAQCLVSVSR